MSGIDGAPPARDNESLELRQGRDGHLYSRPDFLMHYGLVHGCEKWDEANEDTRRAFSTNELCLAQDGASPSEDKRRCNASAFQPSDFSANKLRLAQDGASQAFAGLSITDDHAGVEPETRFYFEGATGSMGPTPDAAQLGDTPCVLTKAQVANFLPTVGAKTAVMECRRLREWCLSQVPPVYKVLMTHAAFEWQCLLASMHKPVLEKVFGTAGGITEFNFLLLRNCRDHNYDGHRHVFEIRRTDGVACHIHLHANGKPDAPVFLQRGDLSLTSNQVLTADHQATLPP